MLYRNLGRSGLKVSALSFGSWVTFGEQIDLLDDGSCGESATCRRCVVAEFEWVYFSLVP